MVHCIIKETKKESSYEYFYSTSKLLDEISSVVIWIKVNVVRVCAYVFDICTKKSVCHVQQPVLILHFCSKLINFNILNVKYWSPIFLIYRVFFTETQY